MWSMRQENTSLCCITAEAYKVGVTHFLKFFFSTYELDLPKQLYVIVHSTKALAKTKQKGLH